MSDGSLPLPTAGWALFLDFDGTLVEIAERPEKVRVAAEIPEALGAIASGLGGALAVVSGRPIAHLDQHLGREFTAAGLHGMEMRVDPQAPVSHAMRHEEVDVARERLSPFVAAHDGLLLEDKAATIALHYRGRPDLMEACRRAVEAALHDLEGVHAMPGRMVFEIKPSNVNKGVAVRTLMKETAFRGRQPVFIGDDVTDEYGFEAADALGGFGVKVGEGDTAARYRIGSVPEVHHWLAAARNQLASAAQADAS